MVKKIILNDEQVKEITELYKLGKSPKEIGDIVNLSKSFIKNLLKNNNVKLRNLSESKRKYKSSFKR